MNPPLAPKKAFLDSTNFQQNLILEKMGSRFHLESKRLFLGKHREGAQKLNISHISDSTENRIKQQIVFV